MLNYLFTVSAWKSASAKNAMLFSTIVNRIPDIFLLNGSVKLDFE